jgi:hypothetical protein
MGPEFPLRLLRIISLTVIMDHVSAFLLIGGILVITPLLVVA